MNRFLRNFLHDASDKLTEVRRELHILRELEPFDETRRRDCLRWILGQIHTIKGSAAAFGFETARESAHLLENLLDSLYWGRIVCDPAALDALRTGVENIAVALTESVNQEKPAAALPEALPILIGALKINANQPTIETGKAGLPAEFFDKLNELEQKSLRQSLLNDCSVSVLAVELPTGEFQDKLQTLRAALEQRGEIISILSGAGTTTPALITLQVVFAVSASASNWEQDVKSFHPQILFTGHGSTSINEAATPAFWAGRRAAVEVGKEVQLNISGGDLTITAKQGSVLTAALLHLVTNAVAHGIESPAERLSRGKSAGGTICVEAVQTAAAVCVCVSDDGRGIDFEKIASAAAKIDPAKPSSEKFNLSEAQQLIFQPGFSTAATLSRISGRGVGLDAAKSAIESVGGTIEVSSKIGVGTTFEIILPRN